ncbi:MAG: hypothetical protein ACXAEU_26655, partial [Candidatus Hodarchaeales archaeon]
MKNVIQGVQVFTQGGTSGAYWYLDKVKPKDEDKAETLFPALLNALCYYFKPADLEESLGEIQRMSINTLDYGFLIELYSNDKGSTAAILRERRGKDWNTSITEDLAEGLLSSYEAIKEIVSSSIESINEEEHWKKLIQGKIYSMEVHLEDLISKKKLYEGYEPILKYTFSIDQPKINRDDKIRLITGNLIEALGELQAIPDLYQHKDKIKTVLSKIQEIAKGNYQIILSQT